jgi:hypothetical protein
MSNYDNLQPLPKPWSNYQLNSLNTNSLIVNDVPYPITSTYGGPAKMNINSPSPSVAVVTSTYTGVSQQRNSGLSNNMTMTANGLTILSTGKYLLSGNISFTVDQTDGIVFQFSFGVQKNRVAVTSGPLYTVALSDLVSYNAGNFIHIEVESETVSMNMTVFSWNITATRIA